MPTEVWFRNPHSYVRELAEAGAYNITWDRGILVKKRIDPQKHGQLYFGSAQPFRAVCIGEQGAAEVDQEHSLEQPLAVYPVWSYGDDMSLLEDLLANPVGDDMAVCSTKGVAPDELPVFGQEHRIVIATLADSRIQVGRAFLRQLKELQEDYPKAIIHIHGTYSWRVAFGTGIRSADVDPRFPASKGNVCLPSGSIVPFEKTFTKSNWTKLLGYEPAELKVPRNRCIYNIRSANWAGENYSLLFNHRFKRDDASVDTDSSDADFTPRETVSPFTSKRATLPGDKFTCDTCSLMDECKHFREGAVCTVPAAEPTPLTQYFGTRDSGMILDGLAILLKSGIKRYERGLQDETITGELLPEVTKQQSQVFEQGVKLAKLIDPALRGSAAVQVNVGSGSAVQVNSGSPRQAIAAAMRELEARGVAREDITPELIQGVFSGMNQPEKNRQAIEGAVVEAQGDL